MHTDPKTPISKVTGQPEGDEPEVEGHDIWRGAVGQPEDNPEDEVQGHRARIFDAEQVAQQPNDEDDDDVEGHLYKKY